MRLRTLLLLLSGAAFSGLVSAAETIVEFKGSDNKTTTEFTVKAPWVLDWRVNTDGDFDAVVQVVLEEARTGIYQGNVLTTKYPGNGVRLFKEGGRFQFRVDSLLATWTLKVQELTEEEAELYTPRSKSKFD